MHIAAHDPPLVLAQNGGQHWLLAVQDVPMGRQPASGGPPSGQQAGFPPQLSMHGPVHPVCVQPESGGPPSGQHAGFCPQLSVHDPVQPVGVQQVLFPKQIAPPEQPQGCGMPQVSATDMLHALPHWLTGEQHEPPEAHS
jgi:hypothetical protein